MYAMMTGEHAKARAAETVDVGDRTLGRTRQAALAAHAEGDGIAVGNSRPGAAAAGGTSCVGSIGGAGGRQQEC